jgi:hypothetical protein
LIELGRRAATFLVMLDFTQAFDMIAHDLMGGFPEIFWWATALLGTYLSDRSQCVRSFGEYSMVRSIEYGVLHYNMVLFIYFIDDLSGVIHFCRLHIYADDLQISQSSSIC